MQNNFDFSNDFENMSVSNMTMSVSPHYVNRILLWKKVFGIEGEFESEEDLIFAIDDSDVDWQAISRNPRLPEFVMEEFSERLDWYLVIANRKMLKSTINKFKDRILRTINSRSFFNEFHGEVQVAKVVLYLMDDEFIKNMLLVCDTNGYLEAFKILVSKSTLDLTLDLILENLTHYDCALHVMQINKVVPTSRDLDLALRQNNTGIVQAILADGRVVPTNQDLYYAIQQDITAIVQAIREAIPNPRY